MLRSGEGRSMGLIFIVVLLVALIAAALLLGVGQGLADTITATLDARIASWLVQ